ncbi:MAG: ATP-grasp domain-containing protein [Patescibacteria group bacterium]|nr:ATP-grasp domain-containing protein [Patescibacteria group bacterium]MCL5431514.1 ATP-grasp domain-containing protein [Patescibacteria group bacterium]
MNITVLFNRVAALPFGRPEEILADEDTVTTAGAVTKALANLGHRVSLFEVNQQTLKKLSRITTDFFFNLAEGIANLPDTEYEVIQVLEKISKPFSGSGSKTLKLTTDKAATKKLLLKNNLPTPKFQVANAGDKLEKLNFPLVVKPVAKDGSIGINGHSVLKTAVDVLDQVDFLVKTYQEPALVEEYIDGRELNVTILDKTVLPVSEIIFGKSFQNKYKMVNFAAKWEEDTIAYKDTVGVCPAKLSPKILSELERICLAAARITGCKNYCRVDLRLSPANRLYILEVNANPGLAPDSGVIRSGAAAGYSYPEFLQKIINVALAGNHF